MRSKIIEYPLLTLGVISTFAVISVLNSFYYQGIPYKRFLKKRKEYFEGLKWQIQVLNSYEEYIRLHDPNDKEFRKEFIGKLE